MNMSQADIRNYYEDNPIDEDDRFSIASSDSSLSSINTKSITTRPKFTRTLPKKKAGSGLELNIM